MTNRRSRTVGALSALVVLTLLVGAGGIAPARGAGAVTVDASIDGQRLGKSSQIQPVKLFPRQQSLLVIAVTNRGGAPIEVRKVRLVGQVIGLTFFAYDTAVSMSVAPGVTETRRLLLDLSGLDGQATGLIPGAVQVLDANRHLVAEQDGVVDVRGSLRSVYGLFGLGVAFLTALSFLGALVGLARHRLQANRWRRGLRFLTPGLGLGLVVNFTLSATRVFVPGIGRWVTITALCAAVLFAMGYLTPTPEVEEDEPEQVETRIIEEIGVIAITARPAGPALDARPAAAQLAPEAPDPALGPRPPGTQLGAGGQGRPPSAPVFPGGSRTSDSSPALVPPLFPPAPAVHVQPSPVDAALPEASSSAPLGTRPVAEPDPRATLPGGFTPRASSPEPPDPLGPPEVDPRGPLDPLGPPEVDPRAPLEESEPPPASQATGGPAKPPAATGEA